MALVNGTNYDHIDLHAASGGDVTRHKLQDTDGRAMVAPTEASSTASAAHPAGSYFIYNNKLYQATSDIASGGTITPNTNCKEAPLGASVSDLKSAIYGGEVDISSEFTFTSSRRVDSTDGSFDTSSSYSSMKANQNFVSVENYDYLEISPFPTWGQSTSNGLAFYSSAAASAYVSGLAFRNTGEYSSETVRVAIPATAKYVRLTIWDTATTFSCKKIHIGDKNRIVALEENTQEADAEIEEISNILDNLAYTSETGTFTNGYYITTSGNVGSTVDVGNPVSSSGNSYAILKVKKGDKCNLAGTGGNSSRLWCFTDNDYKLISKSASNESVYSPELSLTAPSDGYIIMNSTKNNGYRHLTHYYYYEDLPEKMDQKVEGTDTITSEYIAKTYASGRYIGKDGRPASTGSSSWNLYIYDVSDVDVVELTMNHSQSTTAVATWSLIDLPFADFSVSDARDSETTNVITVGDSYGKYSGVKTHSIGIPSTAKTMMVSCAVADALSYPVVYMYNYNHFSKLKEIIENYGETPGGEASPYYKEYLRWGAQAFDDYYHSVDNGTSLFSSSTTAAQYYSMLNTLVGDYSDYVTVTDLGVSSDESTHIYSYTFNPKTGEDGTKYKRPKFIIISGQHGFEKVAPFGIYWFIKNLLEDWQSNKFLAYVRNHVQLVIIPLMNPYGFDEDKYVNANGVNLNRNWGTTGWKEEGSGTSYTGSEPFSEVETQYARDVVLANTDALYMIDYHNNGQTAPGSPSSYLWHAAVTKVHDDDYFQKSYVAAKWHIDEITGHLYVDYPDYCSYAVSGHTTDDNAPFRQGLAKNYACEQEIMAETMEGGAAFIGYGNRYTSGIHHLNADLLGNYLRVLLATYWQN